ncbi:GDSL esterase/lipase [Glycine soja]|uniref:GDSL esterase/lipase n=1 Tax=Glycine soja TaxID=3848 RepID=A0A0B2SUF3_GLYSO|nr:GDSL esterase/lipase [Glycine soja]
MNPVEIEYADALMELCEEMSIKAISLWSAIQTRDDWLDDSFTKNRAAVTFRCALDLCRAIPSLVTSFIS